MSWHLFKKVRPTDPRPFGFLLVLEGCKEPVLGQFDKESQRFYIYVHEVGQTIQVPVKWWMEVPMLPQG